MEYPFMASPNFRTEFDPRYGEAVEMVEGIARMTVNNPSPFTFHGTNTYILGSESLAIIDPGPDDSEHLQALQKAIAGRPVSHIVVTHTHVDHSPLSRRLQDIVDAPIVAEGPHRSARALNLGEVNALDASGDDTFKPDITIKDGDVIEGHGWALTAHFTPGHTANHMAFSLKDTDYLFSGDHVMAWATSIVAPPDGSMKDYMASLEVLLAQPQQTYFPGHGGRLENAHAFVRALRAHRKMREKAIFEQVKAGRQTIPEMVAVIYRTTDKRLHGAAGLSVFAQLEELVANGAVKTDGAPSLDGRYYLVD
jgi:glyoxylase-like metal-dependent hydrolase (beta-lactamase superfamily II)